MKISNDYLRSEKEVYTVLKCTDLFYTPMDRNLGMACMPTSKSNAVWSSILLVGSLMATRLRVRFPD